MLKKIAYIVSLYPCWSETFILNEMLELQKKGVDITILSIRNDLEEHIHGNARPLMKNTIYVCKPKMFIAVFKYMFIKPFIFISFFLKITCTKHASTMVHIKDIWSVLVGCYFADKIKKKGIEHLHAHFATYPTTVAMTISKLTRVPYTFTTHAHDIYLDQTLLKEKILCSKKMITISEYNRKFLIEHCGDQVKEKIVVVHCGIDMRNWKNHNELLANQKSLIITVGRLTLMKGFAFLIDACAIIKNEIDFECRIIGGGHLEEDLKNLIIENGLEKRVFLEGIKDSQDVKKMLLKASLFVMPSVWDDTDGQDGIPIVMMEAMALKVPCIATKLSGLPELVVDGMTGLLAEPGNPNELAQRIKKSLQNRDVSLKMASEGRKKVEKEFNSAINAQKTYAIMCERRDNEN